MIQTEDMRATVAHLATQGVQADKPGSPDGTADFWTAWVTDPDGYRIEFVQWPKGHPDGTTRADLADPGPGRCHDLVHPRSAWTLGLASRRSW